MSVLPIVEIPDPRLRLVCAPVETIDAQVRQLVTDMTDTMYAAHGIGLAAIQVGVAQRVVVIDLQERADEGEEADEKAEPVRNPRAFINPEILSVSEETSRYSEGCLSIPEQYADVERPMRCRVTWLDVDGARHEEDMDGLLSTCMQHEIDHLNGVLFIDHITRLKRDMLLKKLAKARKSAA
ncbi:peptide deformylase [Sphingomonas radiodurans]|uniref:peptide deformylase n=1 Tax=Sphingomonas radiodurans TaxID=2890321 RepID=UPI001E5F1C7A|nr:peptide deformylase [Sphingomonas radiodurans]WBH16405.1 peptide deformylase [Sphingomonas radiodurans]